MCGPLVPEREYISVRHPGKGWSPKVVLLVILALCAVLRGAAILVVLRTNPHAVLQVDSASYLRPALALLNDAHFFHSRGDYQPEFVRTPGYPVFVALVYVLFGVSHTALLLAQVVLSTLTVLVVSLLGARMWSIRVGLLAAALTVVEPLQWFSTGTILSECLATLLLVMVAGIGFVLFSQDEPGLWWSALLGLAIAVATMVRPVTYYLPIVVILLLIYKVSRRPAGLRQAFALLAVFLVPLLVIVGGWQLRNHEQVDSWRFSGVEAKNLYLFRAAGIVAEDRGLSLSAAQRVLINRLGSVHGESQGDYFGRMYRHGLEIVATHPVEAITSAAHGLVDEITSTRSRVFTYLGMKRASGVLEYGAMAALLAFYALCLYGLKQVASARRDLIAHFFVVGVAVYVLLVSAGPEAIGGRGERFRAVVMPILTLYAAKGAYELAGRVRMRRSVGRGAAAADEFVSNCLSGSRRGARRTTGRATR